MATFQESLIAHLPRLRAFARFLASDRALADDLVQETALRALCNVDQFEPGTNMIAWLSTILRNQFFSHELVTRRRLEVYAALPKAASHDGDQEARLERRDFERAFRRLPAIQREALSLVGVRGFTYQEAAEIVHCAQGTMKSRVSRGRSELERLLGKASAAQPSYCSLAYRPTVKARYQPARDATYLRAKVTSDHV